MTPAQEAAFKAAAGGITGSIGADAFSTILTLIAAAALLLWAAYIVLALGDDYLHGRLTIQRVFTYKVRLLVLVMLTIYLLH